MSSAATNGDHDQELTRVIVAELQRMYSRIEATNDSTTTVIQFIVLVFGAGALVASQVPEAIVAVPVFWTVWLLYAVMTDTNTLKYAVVAEYLEEQANERLGTPVFMWESSMAERSNRRPLIFWGNYVYWAALNASAWIVAIAVFWHQKHEHGAVGLALLWLVTWAIGLASGTFGRESIGVSATGRTFEPRSLREFRHRTHRGAFPKTAGIASYRSRPTSCSLSSRTTNA